MYDTTHISQSEFYAFKHNYMNQKDKEKFLEHICSCDYCADQFAAVMSEEIMEAPRDMKMNILKATKRPEVQLAIMAKETSKKMQLFIYSLKVGAATAVALLLLIFSMNIADLSNSIKPDDTDTGITTLNDDYVPLTAVIRDNMDTLSNSILDFSNNIMKTEVTDNDQKKK
jgi:hypothetical protein